VAPGWLNPYIVGDYQLEVANDAFNGMWYILSCHPTRSHSVRSMTHAVGSSGIVAMPGEWSAGPVLQCIHTVAACPHILQALNVLPAYTSCRPMMALTSGALEICTRALGTCEPSCIGRTAKLFFMFESCDPQGTVGHVVAQSPPSREAGSEAA
jgi:hypothetical protein